MRGWLLVMAASSTASAGDAVYEPIEPFETHVGLTADVTFGMELAPDSSRTPISYALSADVGGWVARRVAVLVHGTCSGGAVSAYSGSQEIDVFAGGDIQLWPDEMFWIAGGVGMGVIHARQAFSGTDVAAAYDIRAGLSFALSRARRDGPENAITIAAEVWGFSDGPIILATVGYHFL
ncbi:MAG: hypothetical protein QM831_17775 [Kofleriaceae bacterium]